MVQDSDRRQRIGKTGKYLFSSVQTPEQLYT